MKKHNSDRVSLSRRELIRGSACAVTTAALSAIPNIAKTISETGKEVVHEFPLGTVQLTGGLLKQQFERIHAHYLALSNDRLLKVFRQRVGLPRRRYGRLV